MTVYFLNVIIILFVTNICSSESLFCSYGERFSLCGKHDCVPTCEHPQGPKFCEPKCRPGCVCNSGLVRRETDNKCVPIEHCPNKPGEEKPTSKPDEGPEGNKETTQNPGQENSGPEKSERKGRRLYTQRQAHILGPMCPEKQTFSLCGNNQCQPTCIHPAGPENCNFTCRPGCVCESGYVRRESDHECVHIEDCKGGLRSKARIAGWSPITCKKCQGKVIPPGRRRPWRRGGRKETYIVIEPQVIPHRSRGPWGRDRGFPVRRPCRKRPIYDSYIDIGPCMPKTVYPQIPWGR